MTDIVAGHEYKLVFGKIGKARVVCFCGRWHSYEGYDMKEVVTGIRFMHHLGVTVCSLYESVQSTIS